MNELEGRYYDGRTSARHDIKLIIDDLGWISVKGDTVDSSYQLSELDIPPRIGNLPGKINFPDGATCEVDNAEQLFELLRKYGKHRLHTIHHRWENSLKFVLLAVVITVIAVWGFIKYGVPEMAKSVAYSIPESTESLMGEQTLKTLDKTVLSPSELSEDRRQELLDYFNDVLFEGSDNHKYRIEFRKSDQIGANAFALPSGIILFTDEMVELADNDEELLAVLAHEIGHVENRHIMRHVLQDSATVLLIIILTGDAVSSSSFAVVLPTALVQAKFSRDFESEADQFAVKLLQSHHIPPVNLATILIRLQRNSGHSDTGESDFLSSHPGLKDRIKMIDSADSKVE